MHDLDDNILLREYVERASEEAFSTLVYRHINKVYSVALRHTRNPHQAEEITQAVFVIFAKKSRQLSKNVVVSGWLYHTARLTAQTFIRSEIRRTRREEEAYMQSLANVTEPDVWPQVAPLLDEAMGDLNATDRNAIVLRFLDGKSMRDVGAALGANETAARKRVNRAVEKLRSIFTKNGIVLSSAVLTNAITANSVQAAPTILAKTATAAAIAKGATAGASTLSLIKGTLKVMAWTKAKMTIAISAALVLTTGTGALVTELITRDDGRVKTLLKFDWQELMDDGHLAGGEIVRMDGSTVLKLVGTNELGIGMRLLTIDTPPITEMDYAVVGEMKHDVELVGHLAMWSLFPPLEPGGQRVPYYSFTGALEGPMKKIHSSSDWREFSLPLDRTGKTYPESFVPQMDPAVTAKPPDRLEVSIHCPGLGTVYLRNVKLIQWKALPQIASR